MEIDIKYLSIQNPWWLGGTLKYDPILENFDQSDLKYHPPVMDDIVLDKDLVYILRGPRGCGKTVVLKLIISELIERRAVNPKNILYYSCHNINSYEQLNEIIKVFLADAKVRHNHDRLYIFIDEITLVKNWEKGIEYLRRAGIFKNVELILSGSMLSEKRIKEEYLNNKVYQELTIPTLSFSEFLDTINPDLSEQLEKRKKVDPAYVERLDYYVDIYFLTGGFVSAIDNYKKFGAVKQAVYSNYIYWLIADVAKMGRDLVLFRQVLEKVIFHLGQTLGYKTITHRTKARTHLTIGEYIDILERMFALKVLYQAGDGVGIKKGKAKKIYFLDPFLFWTFYSYIYGSLSYWQFSRISLYQEEIFSSLVKNVVFCHLLKNYSSYDWPDTITFWRDNVKKIEIDFILKENHNVIPILVRYGNEITEQDKQIFSQAGFNKGVIVSKSELSLEGNIKILPLSYFLLYFQ